MVTGSAAGDVFFTDAAVFGSATVSNFTRIDLLVSMVNAIVIGSVVGSVLVGGVGIFNLGGIDATIVVVLYSTVPATIPVAMLFAFVLMSFWLKITNLSSLRMVRRGYKRVTP